MKLLKFLLSLLLAKITYDVGRYFVVYRTLQKQSLESECKSDANISPSLIFYLGLTAMSGLMVALKKCWLSMKKSRNNGLPYCIKTFVHRGNINGGNWNVHFMSCLNLARNMSREVLTKILQPRESLNEEESTKEEWFNIEKEPAETSLEIKNEDFSQMKEFIPMGDSTAVGDDALKEKTVQYLQELINKNDGQFEVEFKCECGIKTFEERVKNIEDSIFATSQATELLKKRILATECTMSDLQQKIAEISNMRGVKSKIPPSILKYMKDNKTNYPPINKLRSLIVETNKELRGSDMKDIVLEEIPQKEEVSVEEKHELNKKNQDDEGNIRPKYCNVRSRYMKHYQQQHSCVGGNTVTALSSAFSSSRDGAKSHNRMTPISDQSPAPRFFSQIPQTYIQRKIKK